VLELKAIVPGVESLVALKGKQIDVCTDNLSALAYVKKLDGTRSEHCNDYARQIWQWAEDRDIWINIAYIPGKQNSPADEMSRTFKQH
jgi:hypothetical protein